MGSATMSIRTSPVGLITGGGECHAYAILVYPLMEAYVLGNQITYMAPGIASGMGLAVVERLVERGWFIYILDKDHKAGEHIATRLGNQVLFLETDITNYIKQVQAFTRIYARWYRLDLGK
jgi:hypothetical protein